MISTALKKENQKLYLRLVSLWILVESFLGGILHGLKIPVTGLVVGGAAMTCIILLARHFPQRGSILKATFLVAIFKLILSPHSPVAAYFAVFFQGILGELILRNQKFFLLRCLAFGFLTLLESAFQRLLILILLSGTDFWVALDAWLIKTTGRQEFSGFTKVLAGTYVLLHVVAGLFLGWAGWKISNWNPSDFPKEWKITPSAESSDLNPAETKNKRSRSIGILWIFVWVVAFGLFFQAWMQPRSALLPPGKILELILRFVLIITTWKIFLNPFLEKILRRWLDAKKGPLKESIQEIQWLLPELQTLVQQAWIRSGTGLGRIARFLKILFFNLLTHE
jgi:hypothetical protein